MARSLKKGPFADAHLLKKVDAMNASGDKLNQLLRHGHAVLRSSRHSSATHLPYMTEEDMCRCT